MNSASELLSEAATISPHAMWLRDHDLIVREYQHAHSLNRNSDRFICCNRAMTRWAGADTQDAAEQKYAEMYNLDWWKLADWNEAMAPGCEEEAP